MGLIHGKRRPHRSGNSGGSMICAETAYTPEEAVIASRRINARTAARNKEERERIKNERLKPRPLKFQED